MKIKYNRIPRKLKKACKKLGNWSALDNSAYFPYEATIENKTVSEIKVKIFN